MADTDAPGWFGKLSMLGDFASRRLSREWVGSCDQWLSEGLRASQEALGEQWLATYLAAPVWRFAWGPGLVDAHWWFGMLMPSCDNVGRYFPLVIAQPRARPPVDRFELDHLELWWSRLAHAGRATLAADATLAAFEDSLQELPRWPAPGRPMGTQAQPAQGRQVVAVAAGATLAELAGGLAAEGLVLRLAGASVWWPLTEATAAGHVTLLPGMPAATGFAALLQGQW